MVRLTLAEAVVRSLLAGLDLVSGLSLNSAVVGLEVCCGCALAQADVSVLVPSCWVDFVFVLVLLCFALVSIYLCFVIYSKGVWRGRVLCWLVSFIVFICLFICFV